VGVRLRLADGGSWGVARGLLIGLAILALGVAWLINVQSAESESRAIQAGIRSTAVIDGRSFHNSCFHFTCNQTEYQIRYPAGGSVYRARVLVDGWDHTHNLGSLIEVVYEDGHPGRVQEAGRPPSSALPKLGAILALVSGLVLTLSWGVVGFQRRHRDVSTG